MLCLHIAELSITFPVITILCSLQMRIHVRAFTSWKAVLGTPVTMPAYKEYDTDGFIKFYKIAGIELNIFPAEAQHTEGEIHRIKNIINKFRRD